MYRHLALTVVTSCLWLYGTALWAAPVAPGPKDKCPVCGMFVKKYPSWVATVEFSTGSPAHFDGAKDMFIYLQNLPRYTPGRTTAMIRALWVKDYYSLTPIDAQKAYYVIGSKVYGPMGHELIPFLRQTDAQEFLLDHQGKRVIRYPEVNPALLKTLE